jgi:hypothetical protein
VDGAALDDDDDAERRAQKLLRAGVVAILIALLVRDGLRQEEMRYLAAHAKSRYLTLGPCFVVGQSRWLRGRLYRLAELAFASRLSPRPALTKVPTK